MARAITLGKFLRPPPFTRRSFFQQQIIERISEWSRQKFTCILSMSIRGAHGLHYETTPKGPALLHQKAPHKVLHQKAPHNYTKRPHIITPKGPHYYTKRPRIQIYRSLKLIQQTGLNVWRPPSIYQRLHPYSLYKVGKGSGCIEGDLEPYFRLMWWNIVFSHRRSPNT